METSTILIVDDTMENLMLLERILATHGYQVVKASSGSEMELLMKDHLPEMILLDVRMPGMDGYEVCRRLKSDPRTEGIPVIFISAQDTEFDKLAGFQAGGIDYISKPIDVDVTIARIQTHFSLRQMQKQLQRVNQELMERVEELCSSRQQLQDQEKKLSAFINAMPNLIFVYDENGTYLEIMGNETNHLFKQVVEMLGKRIVDLLPAPTAILIMEAIHTVIRTGMTTVIEYQLPVVSGKLLWFEGRIALLEKDETGGGRVLLVATEITERVELYQKVQDLAIRDPLTDCYNRRHFFSLAEKEVQRAIRYGRPLSLILMDIDHFKVINDQNGHQVGDHVLHQVVEQCQLSIRGIDILGRYGGEEFILLLPETNRENALLIAERLRHTIESMEIQAKQHEMISVTVSSGVACLQAMEKSHTSLESFIEEADKALYKAKEDGRNCIRTLCENLEVNLLSPAEKVSY